MMRRFAVLSTAAALLCAAVPSAAIEGRLMRCPTLHSDRVVFTYEDDLWSAPLSGGSAARLTSHPGIEIFASFSPGGEWIAFTGSYDGGSDVYVIPASGGEPRRLTYHPAVDRVAGWTPDGGYVLFVSTRGLKRELYRVGVSGGFPDKYPLDRVAYASVSPDGKALAINRFNSDRMNWKGYRGGLQQDVWIADVDGRKFERITDWAGYDNFPMWHGDQIYFNSDREDGRMNIYAYDIESGRVNRCTNHREWDVEFPSMGKDRIVYGCQGYLWIYDILTASTERLSIEIPSDRWQMRNMYVNPEGYLQEIRLGAKGKKCAAQARGDIFLIDTQKEQASNITRTKGSRELHPALSPAGDTVAFFSDRSGEYELYIAPAKPAGEWTAITTGSGTYYYHAIWSPDGKKILFGDKDFSIYVAEVASKDVKRIDRCLNQKDNEIFWEVSDYNWSPDGRWVVFSKVDDNLNSSIFLHDLENGVSHRITDDRYDDYSPCFDPEGKYVYFLSLRNFSPALDPFMDNNINTEMSRLMLVQLRAGEEPPFEKTGEEDHGAPGDSAAADTAAADGSGITRIDLEGISGRVFTVPLPPGTYKKLSAYKGHLAYLARESYGFPGLAEFFNPNSVTHYDLHSFDIEEEKDELLIGGIGFYTLSDDGSKAAYLSGGTAGIIDTDKTGSVGEGALDWRGLKLKVDVFEEYPQIYRDVWRQVRDFFYDPEMHGKDWEAVYRKYEELIPYVATRADMNYIIGHMVGELTASHEYIVGRGGPPRTFFIRVNVGLLGAELEPDREAGRYRFEHILPGSSWNEDYSNPLRAPHIEIGEGDYLLAIDDVEVGIEENYLKHLENKAGREVAITVGSAPDLEEGRTYTIKTLAGERNLYYYEWIEGNYSKIMEATGGRVGYMHLADMDELGIMQFEQAFRAERYRDGLIIDVRENGGGFVSWFLMDKLERRLAYMTVTRDFNPMRYPHGVTAGPVVVICNEGTGSDGEVFSQHFKDLGLGTLVGTPTWGGLIGIINMIPLTDGGMVTQSNVGFANMKGEWVVENRGALPDVYIDNDPADAARGIDSQLEKAVEIVLQKIEEGAGRPLVPPPFPRK